MPPSQPIAPPAKSCAASSEAAHRHDDRLIVHARDGDNGVCIVRSSASRLVIASSGVRCADFINNHRLRHVDLRQCAAPFHLTVRGCPALAEVLLPAGGPGAHIHWDFGEGGVTVAVRGSVEQFDSCQDDGLTSLIRAFGRPFDGVLVVPPRAASLPDWELLHDRLQPEGFVSLGGGDAATLDLLRRVDTLRSVFVGAWGGEAIDIHAPAPEQAFITRSPRLAALHCKAGLKLLRIDGCPRLADIHASGKVLRLSDVAGPYLDIRGGWDHARFTGVMARLISGTIAQVEAFRCLHILPDRVVLDNATDPLGFLPAPEAINDPYWKDLLLGWVTTTTSVASALAGLKVLLALVESGYSPTKGWRARRSLYMNIRRAAGRRPLGSWCWPVREDLEFETYRADLALFEAVRSRGGKTHRFVEKLDQMRRAMPIAVLLRQARDAPASYRDYYLLTVRNVISALSADPLNTPHRRDGSAANMRGMAQLIEAFVVMRQETLVKESLQLFPEAILRLLEPERLVGPLVALANLGLASARTTMLKTSKRLVHRKPDIAAALHAAALQPPRATLLAHISRKDLSHAA